MKAERSHYHEVCENSAKDRDHLIFLYLLPPYHRRQISTPLTWHNRYIHCKKKNFFLKCYSFPSHRFTILVTLCSLAPVISSRQMCYFWSMLRGHSTPSKNVYSCSEIWLPTYQSSQPISTIPLPIALLLLAEVQFRNLYSDVSLSIELSIISSYRSTT